MIIALVWGLLLILMSIQASIALYVVWNKNELGWGELAAIIVFCTPILLYVILLTEAVS